jgi:dGTPase
LNELVSGEFNHYEQSLRIVDVLENNREGLNLTWEVRDGIARHSKGKNGMPVGAPPEHRASTIEGQVARVADIVAYVNHDIDDAVRAGILDEASLPKKAVERLGKSSSERIGTLVSDVVYQSLETGVTEIRMSEPVLDALLELRSFLFDAVYENQIATAEFGKAKGILGGLWEKVHERPEEFLDTRTIAAEGVDVAAQDFLAGMTDRFAVDLYTRLFIPKPWVGPSVVY